MIQKWPATFCSSPCAITALLILRLDDVKDDSEMALTAANAQTDTCMLHQATGATTVVSCPPLTTLTPHASMISVLGRATVSNLHTMPTSFKPPVPGH